MPKLTRAFYARPAPVLAQVLLGKVLVHRIGGHLFSGMIVETEAYHGPEDRACHASRGRTPRTAVMFDTVGHAYVYFTYGMHWLINVTCGSVGFPSAVLIRVLEPISIPDGAKTNGPARLTKALRITGKQNRVDLTGAELWIEDRGVRIPVPSIARAKRIGVEYAGAWKEKPWRFFVKGSSPYHDHASPEAGKGPLRRIPSPDLIRGMRGRRGSPPFSKKRKATNPISWPEREG